MKIGSNLGAYAAQNVQRANPDRQDYQVKVLKQALDSHKDASNKLLKLLEPKGKNLDIQA